MYVSYVGPGYLNLNEARCALTYPPPAIEHENGRLLLPLCMDSTRVVPIALISFASLKLVSCEERLCRHDIIDRYQPSLT